jgi:hypothetical protein
MSENDNENVFFSLDESDQSDDSNEIPNFLDDFNFTNEINDLNNEGIIEVMFLDYKLNYTVKELLLICEYYGISKEMKTNKYNKDVIINVLVDFENNPINIKVVSKRQSMWYCIDKLKNDKFMKKYVLW